MALAWMAGRCAGAFALAVCAACGDDAASSGESTSGTTGTSSSSTTQATGESSGASAADTNGSTTGSESAGDAGTTGAESGTGTGGSSSSTTGDGSSSTGGELAMPADVPLFVDVTQDAGVTYIQGIHVSAPYCMIDQVGPGTGGFCTPERMIGGAAVGDYDGDGDDDLLATRMNDRALLFRNEGDGTFTDQSEASGIDGADAPTSGAAWLDADKDGDLDVYVTSIADYRYYLWINDGAGHFTEEAIERGASLESLDIHVGMSPAVGDYDLDGYPDLYVPEWRTVAGLGKIPSHARLLHNLGADAPGHFEDVTEAAGVDTDMVWAETNQVGAGTYGFGASFADFDGDRWPDLAITADFECSRLFWNNGDGTFLDGTLAAGVGLDENGMGASVADYDGDGDQDMYVTAISDPMGLPENRLYRYEGDRIFSDVAAALDVGHGGWGWGTLFFDANNDADLDLAALDSYYYLAYLEDLPKFWSNQLAQADEVSFLDHSDVVGFGGPRQRRGLLGFDYDLDGDVDLFVVSNSDEPELLRNENGNLGDFLRVETVGTTSDTEGHGAIVRVQAEPGGPWQMREMGSATQYMGQSERVAHFGLPPAFGPVEEVRVYWPVTDQEQVLTKVDRNTTLVVVEP